MGAQQWGPRARTGAAGELSRRKGDPQVALGSPVAWGRDQSPVARAWSWPHSPTPCCCQSLWFETETPSVGPLLYSPRWGSQHLPPHPGRKAEVTPCIETMKEAVAGVSQPTGMRPMGCGSGVLLGHSQGGALLPGVVGSVPEDVQLRPQWSPPSPGHCHRCGSTKPCRPSSLCSQ